MIGIYFGAGSGAEHPWDWNLFCPVKQIIVLGLSSQSVEKRNFLKKFLSMVFFMALSIGIKISY